MNEYLAYFYFKDLFDFNPLKTAVSVMIRDFKLL